mmetsp:Transcript_3319/g.9163  ORF Transcript_3319/g.9163 Transcript_3319/m.9163 type:complete len:108 (+) Transcript_3319:2197-2520(+)
MVAATVKLSYGCFLLSILFLVSEPFQIKTDCSYESVFYLVASIDAKFEHGGPDVVFGGRQKPEVHRAPVREKAARSIGTEARYAEYRAAPYSSFQEVHKLASCDARA